MDKGAGLPAGRIFEITGAIGPANILPLRRNFPAIRGQWVQSLKCQNDPHNVSPKKQSILEKTRFGTRIPERVFHQMQPGMGTN